MFLNQPTNTKIGTRCIGILILSAYLMTLSGGPFPAPLAADEIDYESIALNGLEEVSGVAILPGGGRYAVVGDDINHYGLVWPGGSKWTIEPEVGDLESLDVEVDEEGDVLWLVLGEDAALIAEPGREMAQSVLGSDFREICGRGSEGLALKRIDQKWQVAVLWEGGYYAPRACKTDGDREFQKNSPIGQPKIALLEWNKGQGTKDVPIVIEIDVPLPPSGRFRATDLAWLEEHLVILLGSTGEDGGPPYDHTWLQRFDLKGNRVGSPFKLEEELRSVRKGKNWEALDITAEGDRVVMGYDRKREDSELLIFQNPFLENE